MTHLTLKFTLAAKGSEEASNAALQQLGERVVRYATDPACASTMLLEQPFAPQAK